MTGTADDSDIYTWNGSAFARNLDLSTLGVPTGANLDGYSRVDATHFYASFAGGVSLPGSVSAADEDVVYYNNGTWSLWFDGSTRNLGGTDVDAISLVGGTLYFSTGDSTVPTGAGGAGDDSDVYSWNGTTMTRVWDATNNGVPASADVDGLIWTDATHFYLSFSAATTAVPTLGSVQDEDVVGYAAGAWSIFFDGTANGMGTSGNLDLDAISFGENVSTPPPPPPASPTLYLSTLGNSNPPGVSGAADDSDIYSWNDTTYARTLDLSAAPYNLPAGANVDSFSRVDATHFYVSLSANTALGLLGTVQDEDVLFWNNGAWSVYFDGTAHGLNQSGQDIDAVSVSGGTLYFSTLTSTSPTGVPGAGDDADIYSWNGTAVSRDWDATANGLPGAASVDGYDRASATEFYLSFSSATTTAPQVGSVQDEDVVRVNGSSWSVRFDGTAHGLTTANLDVDAFDVP